MREASCRSVGVYTVTSYWGRHSVLCLLSICDDRTQEHLLTAIVVLLIAAVAPAAFRKVTFRQHV
jgi:hypothetical protein